MSTYRVDISDRSYERSLADANNLDIIKISSATYQVIHQHKIYRITVDSHDTESKSMVLKVNGRQHSVVIKDSYDQLIDKMGLEVGASAAVGDVMAPMPGLVLEVLVEAGTVVEAGTPLLLLEAMKMENIIKSEGEGTVDQIEVLPGAAVEKGQLLIKMTTPQG